MQVSRPTDGIQGQCSFPTDVTLTKVVGEAPGIKSFYFGYDKTKLRYNASQFFYLNVGLGNDSHLYRPFSIASSPTENFLLFTMRMDRQSDFKATLDSKKPGDKTIVFGPMGRFFLPEDDSRNVVMIGKGIGITPFRSMVKYATDTHLSNRITLLYENRSAAEVVYEREWEELQAENPNLKVVNVFTEAGATGGGIDVNLIRQNTSDVRETAFYLCGVPKDIFRSFGLLRSLGVPNTSVKVESFHGYQW